MRPQVTLDSPLSTTVDLPPAWSAPRLSGHASPPMTAPGHRTAKSASDWAVIVASVLGGLVLVLAGAVLLTRRRRIGLAAHPVVWPPRNLGPGGARLMQAATARALPRSVSGPVATPATGVQPHVETSPDRGDDASPSIPALVVRLLGPVEIDGLVSPIRSEPVLRLLVVLLISADRPMSVDELAMVVSMRSTRDPKTPSLQSYASRLRASLPPRLLPDATQGGYRLDHSAIRLDWVALATLAAEPAGLPGWTERAAAALELVRGVPLDGRRWEGIEPFARAMQAQIDRLAHGLAAHLLAANDPAGAELAISQGLTGVPLSVGLWEQRLHAAAGGSGYGLERAWSDAQAILGPDCGLLADTYRQLSRALGNRPPANA